MKTIMNYIVILVSMVIVFNVKVCLFAAEEASSIMCDEGVVDIGGTDADVQDKLGEPDSQNMNEWICNFGPSQTGYTVIFNEGNVFRILLKE